MIFKEESFYFIRKNLQYTVFTIMPSITVKNQFPLECVVSNVMAWIWINEWVMSRRALALYQMLHLMSGQTFSCIDSEGSDWYQRSVCTWISWPSCLSITNQSSPLKSGSSSSILAGKQKRVTIQEICRISDICHIL